MHLTRNQIGFSLIELMIVVAIVSILAMIAIPSYRGYTEKARFAEAISAADVFKTAVELALQQGSPLTEIANNVDGIPDIPPSTSNVASIKVAAGIITVTGTALVHDTTYILTPNEDGSIWTVGGTCLERGLCHA